MPTIVSEEGFGVRIYTCDHAPPHVHVAKAGAVVKIDLTTHEAVKVVGNISERDVKRALLLVARHSELLNREWRRLHGDG